jgi:hypothetical protein
MPIILFCWIKAILLNRVLISSLTALKGDYYKLVKNQLELGA